VGGVGLSLITDVTQRHFPLAGLTAKQQPTFRLAWGGCRIHHKNGLHALCRKRWQLLV
jgi:hypothetical protein